MEIMTIEETIIKKERVDLLKKILKFKTKDLYQFMKKELQKFYEYVDTDGKDETFLYAHGDVPILVVAHLDTIFDKEFMDYYNTISQPYFDETTLFWSKEVDDEPEKIIYHDQEAHVLWSPDGLGGDDRVGVFMILSMIYDGLRPSVLLTTDEEIGSQSGLKFANKYSPIASKLGFKYIIELDRAGDNDCVFYRCDNPKFTHYIEGFGFVEAPGSFTDISHICPLFKIAGVNLSVGYYDEHSKIETINLLTVFKNYDIIYIMLEKSKNILEPFEYIPKSLHFHKAKAVSKSNSYQCLICDKEVRGYMYAPEIGQICIECFEEFYNNGKEDVE